MVLPSDLRLRGSSPGPYAYETHAPPAELRRQLRFIMGGPYQIDFWAASHHVTMAAERTDVACPGSIKS